MNDHGGRLKVVILAAGMGRRLGRSIPKPLTRLADGTSILEQQMKNLSRVAGPDDVLIVVGYKKSLVMEASPGSTYVYNHRWAETNTSSSLRCALAKCIGHDVLWVNGDVVFDPELLDGLLATGRSAVGVVPGQVGDEEVKYRTSQGGHVVEISKAVARPEGEAIGINLVTRDDLALLLDSLAQCADGDYFERGIEIAVRREMRAVAVDVSAHRCIEVDFPEDLQRANELFCGAKAATESALRVA